MCRAATLRVAPRDTRRTNSTVRVRQRLRSPRGRLDQACGMVSGVEATPRELWLRFHPVVKFDGNPQVLRYDDSSDPTT